jgi:hypothetical protein
MLQQSKGTIEGKVNTIKFSDACPSYPGNEKYSQPSVVSFTDLQGKGVVHSGNF